MLHCLDSLKSNDEDDDDDDNNNLFRLSFFTKVDFNCELPILCLNLHTPPPCQPCEGSEISLHAGVMISITLGMQNLSTFSVGTFVDTFVDVLLELLSPPEYHHALSCILTKPSKTTSTFHRIIQLVSETLNN